MAELFSIPAARRSRTQRCAWRMESFRRGVYVAVNYGGPRSTTSSSGGAIVHTGHALALARRLAAILRRGNGVGISHGAGRPRWASDLADRGSSPADQSDGEHRHRVAGGAVEVGIGDV